MWVRKNPSSPTIVHLEWLKWEKSPISFSMSSRMTGHDSSCENSAQAAFISIRINKAVRQTVTSTTYHSAENHKISINHQSSPGHCNQIESLKHPRPRIHAVVPSTLISGSHCCIFGTLARINNASSHRIIFAKAPVLFHPKASVWCG